MNFATKTTRRSFLGMCTSMASSLAFAKGVEEVPKELQGKVIKLIVGFPPGGGTDLAARTLAPYIAEYTGLAVIVDNKPGAGGNIATDMVAKGLADPTSWLFITQGQVITNPLLMKMSYEPMQELSLLARASVSPLVLIVRADAPYKSFDDLMEIHRRKPGSLNYGSAGIGTPQHIGAEWLQSLSGLKAVHSPYKGSGPCIMGLLSGEIDFAMESGAAAAPHVRGGKVRAIAIAGSAKPEDFRDVREFEDSVPGFKMNAWTGLAISRRASVPAKQFAEQVLQACLTNPEFISKLRAQGGNPGWMGAAPFTQAVVEEARVTRDIVTKNNIHL